MHRLRGKSRLFEDDMRRKVGEAQADQRRASANRPWGDADGRCFRCKVGIIGIIGNDCSSFTDPVDKSAAGGRRGRQSNLNQGLGGAQTCEAGDSIPY